MSGKLVPRRFLLGMTAAAVVLPIAVLVIWALAVLLAAMDDPAGALVLKRIAQAGGIFWVLDVIFLVISQAVNTLTEDDSPGKPPSEGP